MSTDNTRHLGVRIERPADDVYDFAADPTNLPTWAAGLGSAVTQVDGRWVAQSPMGRVTVRFVPRNDYGVLDHDVTLPTGLVVHNPMRVVPDGETACDVVFTLRRQPDSDDDAFEADAAAVRRDLDTLKGVLER